MQLQVAKKTVKRVHVSSYLQHNQMQYKAWLCLLRDPQHLFWCLSPFRTKSQEQTSRGIQSKKGQNSRVNGNIHVTWGVPRSVACSAAEMEMGALFLKTKEAKIPCLELDELECPQDATRSFSTAAVIANESVKRSHLMKMQFLHRRLSQKWSCFMSNGAPRQSKHGWLIFKTVHP